MQRPRVRLGTVLILVLNLGLLAALVVQSQRTARLEAHLAEIESVMRLPPLPPVPAVARKPHNTFDQDLPSTPALPVPPPIGVNLFDPDTPHVAAPKKAARVVTASPSALPTSAQKAADERLRELDQKLEELMRKREQVAAQAREPAKTFRAPLPPPLPRPNGSDDGDGGR